MKITLIAAVILFFVVATAEVDANPKEQSLQAYTDNEAYSVYAAVLPLTSSYGSSTGGINIQRETVPQIACIPGKNDSDPKVREAAGDYESANLKRWRLLSKFHVSGPVELVPQADLRNPNFPYVYVAAVGFSKDRSVALVYAGDYCGLLCGSSTFYLAKSEAGTWKARRFGSCGGMS